MSLLLELQVTRIERVLKSIQQEIVKILTKLLDNGESCQIEEEAKCFEDYLHQVKDKIASGQVIIDHHDTDQVLGLTSDIADFDDFMDFEDMNCDVKPDVHSISIDKLVQECLNKRVIVVLEKMPILQINENIEGKYSFRSQRLSKLKWSTFEGGPTEFAQDHQDKSTENDENPVLNLHYKKVGKLFNCLLCKSIYVKFPSYDKFKEHYQRVHTVLQTPLNCGLDGCLISLYSHKEMNLHKDQCHSSCSKCIAKFGTRKALLRHLRESHKKDQYKCKLCYRVYTDSSNLRQHFKRVHIGRKNNSNKRISKSKYNNGTMTKMKPKSKSKNQEIDQKLDPEVNLGSNMMFDLYSDLCKKNRYFKCDIDNCDTIITRKSMDFHKYTHQIPDFDLYWDQLTCPVCKNTFAHRESLRKHIMAQHFPSSLKTLVKCSFCDKILSSKSSLTRHEMLLHSGQKMSQDQDYYKDNCSKCPSKFGTRRELIRHLKESHAEDLFKCHLCCNVYTELNSLRLHLKRIHSEINDNSTSVKRLSKVKLLSTSFEADFEDPADTNETTLEDQIESDNQEFEQDQIEDSFQSKLQGQENENTVFESEINEDTHYKKLGNMFKCLLCKQRNMKYSNYTSFEDHYHRVHHDKFKNPLKCQIARCSKLLYTQSEMLFHRNQAHSHCSKCPSKFETRKALLKHLKETHKTVINPNLKCKLCSKVYTSITYLREHFRRIHIRKKNTCEKRKSESDDDTRKLPKSESKNQEIGQNSVSNEQEDLESNVFELYSDLCQKERFSKCDICHCGKIITKKNLEFHKLSHEIPDFDLYWDQLICPVCKKTFANKESLQKHLMTLHNPSVLNSQYKCTLCDKTFKNDICLKRHEKDHSRPQTTVYNCPKPNCTKTFNLEGTLKMHLKRRHGNIKCPVENCDFHFITQTSYDTHMENYHGEKVVCPICSKMFPRVRLPAHNWRFHRQFKCTFEGCSAEFHSEIPFKKHQAGHDPNLKPEYLCTVCGKEKWTEWSLVMHSKTSHARARQLKCP